MSQPLASVLQRRVCERMTERVGTRALGFTYGKIISKAINGAFQLSNVSKNVIIQPKVFLYSMTQQARPRLNLQMALGW